MFLQLPPPKGTVDLDCNNVNICIENITAALPTIDLNCEEPPLASALLVPSPSRPYNLRSLSKKSDVSLASCEPVGGLGPSSSCSVKKGRGRKTNLSKAQVKAKIDAADGKQMLISGALRAVKPLKLV